MQKTKAIWAYLGPFSQLAGLGLIIIGCLAIGSFLAITLISAVFGIPLALLNPSPENLANPQAVSALLAVQAVSALCMFVIPPFIFARFTGQELFINRLPGRMSFLVVLFLMISVLPLINLTAMWNSSLVLPEFLNGLEMWMKEKEAHAGLLTEAFLDMQNVSDLLITVLVMAVIPAVGEELLFRSVLQTVLVKWIGRFWLALLVCSAIFSFIHFQFYGFVPRMAIGMLLGYLLHLSGSVWLPIWGHFVNNASAVIAAYCMQHVDNFPNLDLWGTEVQHWPIILISLGFLFGSIFLIRKLNPNPLTYMKED